MPAMKLVTRSSATLIDHIYTNDITASHIAGIIITDVADHFGIFHCSKRKKIGNPTTSGNSRFYTNDNINNFKKSLESIDFRDVLKINCPNLAYKCFIDKYKIAFDKAFPLQKI